VFNCSKYAVVGLSLFGAVSAFVLGNARAVLAEPAAPISACDRLAAHPADNQRVVEGVAWDLMNGRDAVRACEDAVKRHPQELRFQYQLGRALLRAKRRDEGLPYLFDVAEKGYMAAFANIGGTYQFDLENLTEALKWYRRGADLDDVSSQTHLAEMYLEGWGVKRDLAEALKWFMPSAQQGYALSQYKVGLVHLRGDSRVPRDIPQAMEWFSKAAAQGFARAQNDLGVLYEEGKSVPRDFNEAAKWYRLASEQGWALAQINLARLYEAGKGVDKDPAEAFYWYRLATQARANDLAEMAREGVSRARTRMSSAQIAAVDERIGAWRSLSQDESATALRRFGGGAGTAAIASLNNGASVVDPVYTPPPRDGADTTYRPDPEDSPADSPAAKAAAPKQVPKQVVTAIPAPVIPTAPVVEERPDIVPEFAVYVAATNANIRSAPAAAAGLIGGLRRGENITVLGRVVGKNWVMVSTADERIGYIHGDLVEPQKAQTPQIALAPQPEPEASVAKAAPVVAAPDITEKTGAGAAAALETPASGRTHALVIGINDYEELPALLTAVNDARAIGEVLENAYGYRVRLLLNATRADIILALDDYRKRLTDQDNLLIYYAGHGYLDSESDRGYWLPVDASGDSQVSWLSNVTITDTLKAIEAKHAMLIVDSCYSGTLTRGLRVSLRGPLAEKRLAESRVRVVLTSGGLEPVVDSGGGNHSVFAKAVLEALRRNKSQMKGSELALQVRRPVMLEANQKPDYADLRFAGHEGGDFIFAARP
jgi:TPR repeat protein/uncharacterized caspase-like protein